MKQLLTALALILLNPPTQAAEIAEINESWNVGENTYTMKTQSSYNQENVDAHKEICFSFHAKDLSINSNVTKETFDKYYDFRANEYKNGVSNLLLISRQCEIIGGTYYTPIKYDRVLHISSTGFKPDTPINELGLAYAKMIAFLSSSQNFPDQKRLVLFLKSDSQYVPVAQQLGFTESNYPIPSYPGLQINYPFKLTAFEKEIK
jgi:hypothetical protein